VCARFFEQPEFHVRPKEQEFELMWHSDKNEIEFWKGVSLFGLTCNHLFLWPLNALSQGLALTYQSFGWFTFASIYFASAGILWGRRAETTPAFWTWNFQRAAKLLLWVCVATLIFKWGVESKLLMPAPWQTHLSWIHDTALLHAALGRQLPWLLDVIWLHAWFGLFAATLWRAPGLRERPALVVVASFLIWLLDQLGLFDRFSKMNIAAPWHSWTSWQLLFVLAAASQRKVWNDSLKVILNQKINRILTAIAVILFAAKSSAHREILHNLTDTQKFAPLFAINSLVLLSLMKVNKKKSLPNCIAKAGRYSLSGYTMQCALVYGLGSRPLPGQGQPLNALLILISAFLFLFAFSNVAQPWRRK
jgi:hypothetical protein